MCASIPVPEPAFTRQGVVSVKDTSKDERNLSMYLFIACAFLFIMLYMANLVPPDERRFVITLRILILSAAIIAGFFGILSYFGKWG